MRCCYNLLNKAHAPVLHYSAILCCGVNGGDILQGASHPARQVQQSVRPVVQAIQHAPKIAVRSNIPSTKPTGAVVHASTPMVCLFPTSGRPFPHVYSCSHIFKHKQCATHTQAICSQSAHYYARCCKWISPFEFKQTCCCFDLGNPSKKMESSRICSFIPDSIEMCSGCRFVCGFVCVTAIWTQKVDFTTKKKSSFLWHGKKSIVSLGCH